MTSYFLSDLHLGAPYFKDPKVQEKKVVDFLDSIKEKADRIYLIGDILDYWYEYKYVVPKGFVRFFGKLAELSDSGIRIIWLIGNHDIWIKDYLPTELGIEVIDGDLIENIDGKNFFLSHGDGIGRVKPSFKFLRTLFRNKFCQRLYSAIHPRWTIPFATNWSSHSRKKDSKADANTNEMIDNLISFSKEYLTKNPNINYFVYGHLHIIIKTILNPTSELFVLGDWISRFSYGIWDGNKFSIEKYTK